MGDRLIPKERLLTGKKIQSDDRRFSLVMQEDGNLVLYQNDVGALWHADTRGRGNFAIMQHDGNLVVYTSNGTAPWSTKTQQPGSVLILQNDGNLVIYAPGNRAVWASNTRAHPTSRKTLPDFPKIIQPDDISCGAASAAMVLRWYGKDAGIQQCKTQAGTQWLKIGDLRVGMTIPSGLAKCLNSFGLASSVQQNSRIEDLIHCINDNRPPILLVRSGVKFWHWFVVIGYDERGANFTVSDPGDGKHNKFQRGTLDATWNFSADLNGNPTGNRRCDPCGGSGKLVSGQIPCTGCAGTGKIISGVNIRNCNRCDGTGRVNASAGNCLVCSGTGKSPDSFRMIVEGAQIRGRTMVVPNRGR